MTLRPCLPAPRAASGTLRAVPRSRGKPPPAVSAELRSRAIAIVAGRAERGERPTSAAALAAELRTDPTTARAILDELRAADLAPPAVIAGASGRRMAAPPDPGRVVRLSAARLARLATLPGDGPLEQIDAAIDRAGVPKHATPAERGEE